MFVTPLQSEVEKNPSRSWLITIDSKPREQLLGLRTLGQADLSNSEGWQFAAVQLGLEFPRAPDHQRRPTGLTSLWSVGILVRYGGIFMISYFLHTVYSVYVVWAPLEPKRFARNALTPPAQLTSRHWLYSQEHVMGFEYTQSLISKRYPIYTQRSSNNPHV